MPNDSKGFSLLEILVAITIFSVISLGMFFTMDQYFSTAEVLARRNGQFIAMNRFLALIERDIHYGINRKVRGQYGDHQEAIVAEPIDGNEFLSITSSLPDYRIRGQSRLVRISWGFYDNTITRSYWQVLDRAVDSEPITHKILTEVIDVQLAVKPDLTASEGLENSHVDYQAELTLRTKHNLSIRRKMRLFGEFWSES